MTDKFDGHALIGRAIKITKAGDGLSKSLLVADTELAAGDEVTVVLRGVVGGVNLAPVEKDDLSGDWTRTDTIVTRSARIVIGDEMIESMLDDHEAAVDEAEQAAKEAREGIVRIPYDDATDEAQAAEDGVTPADLQAVPDPSED